MQPFYLFIEGSDNDSDGRLPPANNESDSEISEDSPSTSKIPGLTRGEPQELLAQLREMPSMEYSLTWIQRSLNRAADDREDGR